MPPHTASVMRPDLSAVEACELACRRGGRLVFAGVSFRLQGGQGLAVTGPNGAGKSSLLRVMAGLLAPDAGTLRFLCAGGAGADGPVAHFLGHADALKPAFTLRETLRFAVALYSGEAREAIGEASSRVGLGHALDLPVGVLSAGQRRRAGLARLIVAPRPLWLLDEPSAALDRAGEDLLAGLMQEHLASGGIIVAATHQALPLPAQLALEPGGGA